jgi:hypothetical protein
MIGPRRPIDRDTCENWRLFASGFVTLFQMVHGWWKEGGESLTRLKLKWTLEYVMEFGGS